MKTNEVLEHLKMQHDPMKWAYFEELRIGTGYSKDSLQRLDAWAIHYFPSHRNVTRCYEVKVSKSDFKKEIDNPIKRRAGMRFSNEFYFVTPKGLCDIDDIPLECGLMEVDSFGEWDIKVPAPFRDINPPTWLFLSAICRRLDKHRIEEYLKYMEEDRVLQAYGHAAVKVLKEHIEKWKNFNQGNKEIPDKIADALTHVLHEVKDVVEINKRIK